MPLYSRDMPDSFPARSHPSSCLRDWLGGLDSNQDNQIQSLMYYRLYDLPTVTKQRGIPPQNGDIGRFGGAQKLAANMAIA